jgi:hypothetical protein
MKASELKFRVTNKKTGESAIISLNDIFGYEGERCGVFVSYNTELDGKTKTWIPDSLKGSTINYNSGYGYDGEADELEFDYV